MSEVLDPDGPVADDPEVDDADESQGDVVPSEDSPEPESAPEPESDDNA